MLKRVLAVALVASLIGMTGCARMKELKSQNASLTSQVESLEQERAALLEQNGALETQCNVLKTALDAAKREGGTMADALRKLQSEEEKLRQQALELKRLLATFEDIDVETRDGANFVSLDSDILFAPGKAELSSEATAALDKIMGYLSKYPNQKIRVDGHTDGVPITHSEWKDNYHLGAMRALAVMRYLVERGLNPSRAYIAGFGPNKPKVQPGEATADVAENRRVEIFLVPDRASSVSEILGQFGLD